MSADPDAHLDPLMHVAQPDHPDREAQSRAEAGRAIRDLGHAIVGRHASVELIDRVTHTLDGLTAELEPGATRSRSQTRREGHWDPPPDDGATLTSFDERPVSGRASPWGLDLHVWRDGDEAVASLTLRAAHEGAPARSHGGIVAALFDDVFGFVLSFVGEAAFTGELGIRYEAGVPIGVPLECRVRLAERSGRKLYMTGELRDGDRVVTRATATFISIPPERFAKGLEA